MHAFGLVESDAHVFDEVVDEEPGSEVATEHARAVVAERPRSGGAPTDGLEGLVEIEPGLLGVEQRFADADHPGCDEDLVHHLGVLPSARSAEVSDGAAEHLEQRPGTGHIRHVTPDHDRERCVASSHIAAGHGGVDGTDVACGGRSVDLSCQRRLAGRHVDDDAARPCSCDDPVGRKEHFSHVRWVSDDGEDEVAASGNLGGRAGPVGTS